MLTPAPRPLSDSAEWDWDWRRHQLQAAEHAGTVVLSGSARALFNAGDKLTWCGDQVTSTNPSYDQVRLLSQFNGPDDRTGRRDGTWECMILADR